MKDKKLQVFVSSTYTDLITERQAAVEAILSAGHIPAGMELFTAGDESQISVIRKWIDESDVFLLILGGRYGSVDKKTKKSYTQLEYEYAIQQKKYLFAIVISKETLEKRNILLEEITKEKLNRGKLESFRAKVFKKIVKIVSDNNEIQIEIHRKLSELESRQDIVGWTRCHSYDNEGTKGVAGVRHRHLIGKWIGLVQQIFDKNLSINFYIEIELTPLPIGCRVIGKGLGYQTPESKFKYKFETDDYYNLDFDGYFRNDRFLKLEYFNTEKNNLHFGTFILELKGGNDRLVGRFTGFGHVTDKLVYGLVELKKII